MKKIIILFFIIVLAGYLYLDRKAYDCHYGDYNPNIEGARDASYHCHSFFEGEHVH